MSNIDKEFNDYLNPLLTKLMGDSFNTLKEFYDSGSLKEMDSNELEFFTKFIIDAREFYANLPDRMDDLDKINTHIQELIKSKNNSQ